MKILIALAIIIFSIGTIYIKLNSETIKKSIANKNTQKVKITPTVTSSSPTSTPTSTPYTFPTSHIIPTTTISTSYNNDTYIYPEATTISRTADKIVLHSTDDPKTITNWYKSKIKAMGLGAQSFVTTSSNGVILNKLSASGKKTNITVTISKNSNSSTTTIEIEQ